MTFEYKKNTPFEKRYTETQKILARYTDRVPVLCELNKNVNLTLDKKKFLTPNELTIGAFMSVIRKRISLDPAQAMFMFINNNTMPCVSERISDIYYRHKDEDGFLYIMIALESTFGQDNHV